MTIAHPLENLFQKNTLDLNNIQFGLKINGEYKQQGNSQDLIFSFDKIIAYVSQFISLKVGDLIYTGTPEGVGPVKIGDELEGEMNGTPFLHLTIR